jgi:choline dehydrogenase
LGKWPTDLLDEGHLAIESHDWGFADGNAARGRVLGGCSSVNASLVVQSPPGDYTRWAKLGNEGWDFTEQSPFIREVEAMLRTAMPNPESLSWFVEPFIKGCEKIGYPRLASLNGPEWKAGVAPAPRNVHDGIRWNSAFAYLDPARARPNLTILSESIVDRVLIAKNRATGVVVQNRNGTSEILADSVVLSTGTYMSPTILQRSGIGPSELLKSLGISVLCDLDGVGKNLGDHSGAVVQYQMDSSFQMPTNGLPEVILHSRSSLTQDQYWDSQVLIWHSGSEEESLLNFGLHAMESDSRGFVRALSQDPNILPEVTQPWTQLSVHDLQLLIESVETVREICATGVFGPGLGAEITPGAIAKIDEWIRTHTGGYWHPVGTCKMGINPNDGAVVDSRGRVYGITGLRVVDASIYPAVPRSNPNAPTMAAAEFIASTMRAN